MSLQHPLIFLLFSAALVGLSASGVRSRRRQLFFALSLLFVLLQFQFAAKSLVVFTSSLCLHYAVIRLMLRLRSEKARFLVFLAWLVFTLFAFAVVKEYYWITGVALPAALNVSSLSTIGLSFLLFRQIHLASAVKDEIITSVPPLDYLNYNLAFWTFLAGPIQRFQKFQSEFAALEGRTQPIEIRPLLLALNRVLTGMIKLFFVARFFEHFTGEKAFIAEPTPGKFAWLIFAYPLYLYTNFSGYCDIVIGVAAAVGFNLPENFHYPWVARNSIDYWTRWHMTLSEFFRDYVYFPFYMFLSRRGVAAFLATALAAFASFTLMGAWHGSRFGFVVFGMLHAGGVITALAWDAILKARLSKTQLAAYRDNAVIHFFSVICFQAFVFLAFLPYQFDSVQLLSIAKAIRLMFTGTSA